LRPRPPDQGQPHSPEGRECSVHSAGIATLFSIGLVVQFSTFYHVNIAILPPGHTSLTRST
jgi:hypothetical protein